MRQVTLSTTDASGGATYSALHVPDHNRNPFNVGLGAIVTGTVDYTVQHTFDDVQDPAFDASTATWFPHSSMAALAVNADGFYNFPVRAIRLVQNSGNGSVVLKVQQAGLRGG